MSEAMSMRQMKLCFYLIINVVKTLFSCQHARCLARDPQAMFDRMVGPPLFSHERRNEYVAKTTLCFYHIINVMKTLGWHRSALIASFLICKSRQFRQDAASPPKPSECTILQRLHPWEFSHSLRLGIQEAKALGVSLDAVGE